MQDRVLPSARHSRPRRTVPTLALDGVKNIDRAYRQPGQPLPERAQHDDGGRPYLRPQDAKAEVRSGALMHSITNIVGVRDKPRLFA